MICFDIISGISRDFFNWVTAPQNVTAPSDLKPTLANCPANRQTCASPLSVFFIVFFCFCFFALLFDFLASGAVRALLWQEQWCYLLLWRWWLWWWWQWQWERCWLAPAAGSGLPPVCSQRRASKALPRSSRGCTKTTTLAPVRAHIVFTAFSKIPAGLPECLSVASVCLSGGAVHVIGSWF